MHSVQAKPAAALKRKETAFSLIELVAVLAIVGILLALILGVSGYADRASREAKARADIEKIRNALQEYMLEHSAYPNGTNLPATTITELLPPDFDFDDPWGKPYEYQVTGVRSNSYRLFSYGRDGRPGTDDDVFSDR